MSPILKGIIASGVSGNLTPNAPTIGTATAGDAQATVTFTAAASGPVATSFTVVSSPSGIQQSGASSPITVSGLANGTAYTFTVYASNALGNSPSSAASNPVTPVAASSFESIASSRLTTNTAAITFNSIPQTFKHLQIRWAAGSNGGDYLHFTTNLGNSGKTGRISNYGNSWYNNMGYAQDPTYGVELHFGGIDGTYPAAGVIEIMDYSSTTKSKIAMSRLFRGFGDPQYTVNNLMTWECGSNLTAINSVTFQAKPAYPLVAGTTVSLYGIKG